MLFVGRRLALGLPLALFTATCTSSPVGPGPGHLTVGTWGAREAAVLVTDSVVHIHIGCTFGDMPPDIALDANGRFTVNGSFVLRAYPVQMGPSLPAQFSGQVVGRRLTLAVAVNDTVAKQIVALGPITVTLGVTPTMANCPICAVPRAMELQQISR